MTDKPDLLPDTIAAAGLLAAKSPTTNDHDYNVAKGGAMRAMNKLWELGFIRDTRPTPEPEGALAELESLAKDIFDYRGKARHPKEIQKSICVIEAALQKPAPDQFVEPIKMIEPIEGLELNQLYQIMYDAFREAERLIDDSDGTMPSPGDAIMEIQNAWDSVWAVLRSKYQEMSGA